MNDQENLWAYQKRFRFVRSVIEENFPARTPSSIKLVDIGCGNGSQLSIPLAHAGFHVTGIDPDESSIAHAVRLSGKAPFARFQCASIQDLSETFDVVILSEVLEHVMDPAGLLKASVQRLAAGGVVIVTTPNGYGEFEMDTWLFEALRMQRVVDKLAANKSPVLSATDNHDSGHVQFFTRRRLYRIFEECGLSVFREGSASLFAGPFAGHLLARSPRFIQWNAEITNRLPMAFASGWYFALRRVGVAE